VLVRGFNPANPLRPVHSLRRDHRKYLGIDGLEAIVGGICIGDEWAGDADRDAPPWRDTAARIAGPAVPALEWSFLRMWEMAGGRAPAYAVPSKVDAAGGAGVRIVEGVPGRLRLYRAIELLAASAAERLWVTDAYLVVATPLFASIRSAARDGVDVRLLVPGHTDIPAVRALTRVGYRELLHAGVRIWEWHGPMLHAKTVVIDDRTYKLGSSNLNPSSFLANYELDVLIEHATATTDAAAQFRRDLSQAVEIVLRPVRAPEVLQARIPPAVVRAEPRTRSIPARALGERSRRAVMTLRKVAAGARRSVAGAITFASLGTGVLFLTLPRLMAYVLAILSFALGLTAAWQYLQRRRHWTD
jgi:cardiolipin synthase